MTLECPFACFIVQVMVFKKNPKQSRSKETVDTILQAVVSLVDQGKSEALTTTHIADRAGVSIGSVYQYFPDKAAIFTTLIEWYMKKELIFVRETLKKIGPHNLEESVTQLVDGLFEVRRKNVSLESTLLRFFSKHGDTEFISNYDRTLAVEVEKVLEEKKELLRKTELTSFLLIHTIRPIFFAATLERPELYQSPLLAIEMKHLLHGYLKKAN